ncbi:shikimate kinase [Litorimonas haliclonae]|uniref:shikimate kinase n=1 Tax=Litorimonas haliclonae TaxID=2081977 RepID=UPI0039F00EBD
MKLSRSEFETRYNSGKLRLAFIGMSNIGKSYTAKRVADQFDFTLIEVDKLIWEELGHDDMASFAEWQGQPYSKGYSEREEKSISLETAATRKALRINAPNTILDTTGSVIYTGDTILKELSRTHYVVYIQATEDALERLKLQYFQQPKPLIWKSYFEQVPGQSDKDAVLASYPKLLEARAESYDALADAVLSSEYILNSAVSVEDIFKNLKPAL